MSVLLFKQKTAYELRISDWSSDVCSSDLSAQGDVDLLVKTLGQRLVKKTMFYDGARPVYHLYFGNELGEPGTLYTTFPVRQAGYTGKRGAGQISAVSYNAPVGTLSWWQEHLIKRAVTVSEVRERFGQ